MWARLWEGGQPLRVPTVLTVRTVLGDLGWLLSVVDAGVRWQMCGASRQPWSFRGVGLFERRIAVKSLMG